MAKRIKKRIVVAPSKTEVGDIMKNFAEATSKIKALEAEEELQLLEIRRAYEEKVKSLLEQKQEALEKLEAFGIHNKDEFFDKKRSMDLHHGIIGFRTGTPKVSKPRSITWNKVIESLNQQNSAFLRTRLEVDKDKIIASRDDKELMTDLENLGITVVQDETFFVSVKEGALESMAYAMS